MKILAILVIYNKHLSDSASFQAAVSQPDVQLLVVDNSTDKSFNNQEEAYKAGAWFLSMNGNKGLPKGYNAAFDYLKDKDGEWIVLLDDDTEIPNTYWAQLRLQNSDAILLPVVLAGGEKMISPAEMKYDFPCLAHSPETIKDITGINSGMAIPKSLADGYRYDERYFLDYIDHQFLRDIKKIGYPIRLLQATLIQSFSADNMSLEDALRRLKVQKADLAIYYENDPWKARYLILKRKLRLTVQYKNIGVLFHE